MYVAVSNDLDTGTQLTDKRLGYQMKIIDTLNSFNRDHYTKQLYKHTRTHARTRPTARVVPRVINTS